MRGAGIAARAAGRDRLSKSRPLARHHAGGGSAPPEERVRPMQVLLMIYSDEAAWASMSAAEKGEAFAAYGAYSAALRDAGVMVGGNPLQPSATAHTVRLQGGAPQVLDGPYAETREQLGGYYLLEVADMQDALRWAARCPGAAHGAIEVRPIMPMPAG
jgi:hypothetical protein